jgi:hypothetical protein
MVLDMKALGSLHTITKSNADKNADSNNQGNSNADSIVCGN